MGLLKNNPWTILQTAKIQFQNTESNFNDVIVSVLNEETTALSNTLVGASGYAYTFERTLGETGVSIHSRLWDDENQEWLDVASGSFDGVNDLVGCKIGSQYVADILNDCNSGEAMNGLVANICNAYQSSVELSIADIEALINQSQCATSDKTKLLKYCSNVVTSGKLSNYGWIAILQQLAVTGEESTAAGTIIMDESKPFLIQSIASTVLSIVSTVISTIALYVHNAFTALLYVFAQLATFIFQRLQQDVSNTLSADLMANNYFVAGPVKYCYDYNTCSKAIHNDIPCLAEQYGPFMVFTWPGTTVDDSTVKFNVNAFINVGFDIEKAITYVCQNYVGATFDEAAYTCDTWFSHSGAGSSFSLILVKEQLYADASYYLSQEKCVEILSNEQTLTRYIAACIQFDLIMNMVAVGSAASSIFHWNFSSISDQPNWPARTYTFWDPSSLSNRRVAMEAFMRLFGICKFYHNGTFSLTDGLYASNSDIVNFIQIIYNGIIKDTAAQNYANEENRLVYELNYNSASTNVVYASTLMLGYYPHITNFWDLTDSIPVDRCITIPNVTADKIIAAMTILAIAVCAAVVVKTVATKIIKKRSTAKRLSDKQNLIDKGKAYEDACQSGDSDTIREKYNDYYKAIKRYNLKAKLLGYQTYDPVNQWFDNPDGSATSAALITGNTLPSTLANIDDTFTKVASVEGTVDNHTGKLNTINNSVDTTELLIRNVQKSVTG